MISTIAKNEPPPSRFFPVPPRGWIFEALDLVLARPTVNLFTRGGARQSPFSLLLSTSRALRQAGGMTRPALTIQERTTTNANLSLAARVMKILLAQLERALATLALLATRSRGGKLKKQVWRAIARMRRRSGIVTGDHLYAVTK